MKYLLFIAIILSFAYCEYPVEDGILVLTESNFEEAVLSHSYMLIEFYAPVTFFIYQTVVWVL